MSLRIGSNLQHEVKVKVNDSTKRVAGEKTATIIVRKPEIRFYSIDPLRGPEYHKAILETFSTASGSENQFLAVPYFFSLAPSSLTHEWRINSTPLTTTGRPDILTLRSEPGSVGKQTVSLEIRNPGYLFEQARSLFSINVN